MSSNGSRVGLSKRLRYEVMRRDDNTCRYCGGKAPDVSLTVDHVIPVTLGGSNEPGNLVTACVDCNAGKSSVPPDAELVDEVDDSALLYARAIDQVNRVRSQELAAISAQTNEWLQRWQQWTYPNGSTVPVPPNWRKSVQTFVTMGLSMDALQEKIEAAMNCKTAKDEFSYFCGCCWTEIRARQAAALALIERGEVE